MSSAFDFINNDEANEEGGEEGFSFADAEKNESKEMEFSFGQEENDQKNPQNEEKTEERKKGKQPVQKRSRVIGVIHPKKPERKPAKFAKKYLRSSTPSPSPEKIKGSVSTSQIPKMENKNKDVGSILTRTRSSDALFDLSGTPDNSPLKGNENTENTQELSQLVNQQQQNNENNEEIKQNNEKQQEENEESAFDFISEEKPQTNTDVQENVPIIKEVSQKQKIIREVPKFEKKFEREDFQKFAEEMHSISFNVQEILKDNQILETSIKESEKVVQEYSEKEEYEKADEISTKLNEMKTKIIQQTKEQSNYVQRALAISHQLPNIFQTHSREAQVKYEQLVKENEKLNQKLNLETTTKQKNEITVQKERDKNKFKISQLEKPIKDHENKINALQEIYDSNVHKVSLPFDNEISNLSDEKTQVNDRIEQLLKEVEQLRARDKQIDQSIAQNNIQKQHEISKFDNDKNRILNERQQLANEKQIFDKELRKIEAPYQKLIDDVNRRTKVIADLQERIKTTEEGITTNKKAAEEEEDTLRIMNSLLEDYTSYSSNREILATDLDNNREILSKSTSRMKELNIQMITFKSNLDISEEMLAGAKAKEDQLEAEKKKFVAAKNFRMAKQITEQLSDFKDLTDRADKTIAECALGISNGQEELEKLKVDSSNAENNIKELTDKLNTMDFEFFDQTLISLEALFKVSDFASSLLETFDQMINKLLELAPQPPQLTKEEIQAQIDALNAKIDEAVAIEDYDTCETLQEKVDVLTAKLEKFK